MTKLGKEKSSVLFTAILTPIVLILLILSWFRGGVYEHNPAIEPLPPASDAPSEHVIAGYFVDWAIYDRGYNVVDLGKHQEKLSHVLYAFANLDSNGTIVLGDAWADKDKHFPAEQTINHQADDWNESGNNLYGNLKQFYLLKKQNRQLKVSLSIGGWSWSGNFSTVAKDPMRRERFCTSALEHVVDYGLDGIDIDWEMPRDAAEATAYVDLLHDLRAKLGSTYLISVAVPSGPDDYRKLELERMAEYVDLFYLMAYDLAGAWDPVTGHQAALYGTTGGLTVKSAVEDYIQAGVPPRKLIMGLPVYGRGYAHASEGKPGASFEGVPKGSWEEGSYDYKDLPQPGATEYVDEEAMASYSYDPEKHEYVTYDNPRVIKAKCDFVREMGLGGVMFWELSADQQNDKNRSLLQTAYDALQGRVHSVSNTLEYPLSQFDNVRNGM